jgi:hypothetical protein
VLPAYTTPGTSSYTSCLGRSMDRSQVDLGIALAVAVLACAAAAVGAPVAVTAMLGITLMAAPGYLWGQLLLGSRIAGTERVAVITGLSLCVPILGGLLLAVGRVPLHRAAWLGLLAGVTLIGDLALFLRRRSGQAAPTDRPEEVRSLPTRHVVAFGAAVVIAASAVGLARVGAAMQHYPGFTQLWLAHPNQNAATANLGVGNYEGRTTRYRLVLLRKGRPAAVWNFTLTNGQTWHRSPAFAGRYTIAANLYRLPDLSRPYRYVAIDGDGAPRS